MYEQGYKESVDQELTRRSFDPMASVRRFSDDIRAHGTIFPETRQQVLDEELSYLSEGMDRAVTTRFVMKRMDGDLVYFYDREWRPYTGLLISGLEVANEEAHRDYRKKFWPTEPQPICFMACRCKNCYPVKSIDGYPVMTMMQKSASVQRSWKTPA